MGAGGLVLDQHDIGLEQVLLVAYSAFERGVFQPSSEDGEEEEVLAFDPPSRAHAEITELGRLVGGVPALHDAVESLRPFVLAIALEPFRLDQAAPQRGGGLLILAREIVFSDRPPDAVEGVERLARGVQRLTLPAPEASRSPDRLDPVHLIDVSDRWIADSHPSLVGEHVAGEVSLGELEHEAYAGDGAFVIEPAVT